MALAASAVAALRVPHRHIDVAPGQLRADLRAMESVTNRDAACTTLASFVVEDGKAGAQKT